MVWCSAKRSYEAAFQIGKGGPMESRNPGSFAVEAKRPKSSPLLKAWTKMLTLAEGSPVVKQGSPKAPISPSWKAWSPAYSSPEPWSPKPSMSLTGSHFVNRSHHTHRLPLSNVPWVQPAVLINGFFRLLFVIQVSLEHIRPVKADLSWY